MKKQKVKHAVVAIPGSLEEAAEFISRIGKEQREIKRLQTKFNEEVEKLKTQAMVEVMPHEEDISRLTEGLYVFAESRRDELTEKGKRKIIEVPTGRFGWRLTPFSVLLRDIKEVIASLKSLSLHRFLRIKEEVDKEAMLKEPEIAKTVKGVTLSQHEEFLIKPAELEIEIASEVGKLKKKVAA